MNADDPLEVTQQTLAEHLDEALAAATDETAIFHLRHAKQLAVDLPTLVDAKRSDGFAETADETTH